VHRHASLGAAHTGAAVQQADRRRPLNGDCGAAGLFGRADLAADYYDKNLFDGATFADLQRLDAPLVVINATDLATGTRFPFSQEAFDLLCADLGHA
jgi:NTE family protein